MHATKNVNQNGQALIEYLLIFAFVTFIAIGMVRGLGKTLTTSVGYIGYELTEQLTVGVCAKFCYFNGYNNQQKSK